jgi:hypothetical protein
VSGTKTIMRCIKTFAALLFMIAVAASCKKDNSSTNDCFPNTSTVRQVTNAQATVKKAEDKFYLVEQGSIDTKLNPCLLPQEFQVDELHVTISGDVRSRPQGASEPCCTENFVITKISK